MEPSPQKLFLRSVWPQVPSGVYRASGLPAVLLLSCGAADQGVEPPLALGQFWSVELQLVCVQSHS